MAQVYQAFTQQEIAAPSYQMQSTGLYTNPEVESIFAIQYDDMPVLDMQSTGLYADGWSGSELTATPATMASAIRRVKPGGGTGGQDTENPYIKTEPIGSGIGILIFLALTYQFLRRHMINTRP